MSQHKTRESETFGKEPLILLSSFKAGAFRRKRTRGKAVLMAVGMVAAAGALAVVVIRLAPTLLG